jgi:hypothetical protein
VNRENAVFRKLIVRVVGTINGGHEVGVIEEESQSVEGKGPSPGGGGRHGIGQEK